MTRMTKMRIVKASPTSPCVSFLRERESDCLHCALRASALFSALERAELNHQLQPIHNGLVDPDTLIYQQGDPAEAVFTVRSGVVKLIGQVADEPPRILRLLGRGAAIGLEVIEERVYEHTAIAMREVSLCRIPKFVIQKLAQQSPRLSVGLIAKWREHAFWSDRWIGTMCRGQLKDRAVAFIRLLAEISGDSPEAVRLPLTSDMADILGCSPEGISRCMAEMKRQGLLERVAPWTYRCDPSLIGHSGAGGSSAE